jgi:hypothetical protein
MIVHILRFSFKDAATDSDVSATLDALRDVGRMQTVSFSVVGEYSGGPTSKYTHSAVYGLADLETFDRYMYEPVHHRADFVVHPHVTNFDVSDVSDGNEPDLAASIAEIQQRRIDSDPELAKLVDLFPKGISGP